ncbi:MDR family MFS transporter [Kouleothrix sp.]|uniref:MDR family MFS transporter n=1 Tax=Kouleothrix sp. TaxID=2779161 RepID=UPI003919E34C
MPRQRVILITIGIMLSLFMASMESTVVATAMPTIVSQLGGLSSYSWVFSVYMLTSTTTVPLYGKLSDIYGRRPIYAVAMGLFLLGSLLCGLSQSMSQLIAARAVQGLGAGGLLPLAFIIIGDLFTFEQRARLQGVFSGVWGVSSIVGPLLGGFLVDQISWHWVFYVNVIPGMLAFALVWRAWQDRPRAVGAARPAIDYAGAGMLTFGVVALLLGLAELGTPLGWAGLGLAALLFGGLALAERRAADPVLPLGLFRDRMFAVACAHGVLAGWAMFGSTAYVPLYVQAVLGTSATAAGATLTPMLLAWVTASIIGSRLLLKIGYRTLSLAGMVLLVIGALALTQVGVGGSALLIASLALMGVGMGLSIPAFLIAVQSSVPKQVLGTATSTLQFSRSIGGTLGVSVMGALLSARLASGLLAAGLDPAAVSLNTLLDPLAQASGSAALDGALRTVLAGAMQGVFWLACGAAALGLLATALAPAGQIGQLAARPAPAAPEGEHEPQVIGMLE